MIKTILNIVLVVVLITIAAVLYTSMTAPHVEETLQPLAYNDSVVVDTLAVQSPIASPLTLQGSARGTWFFEGSFPITLTDWDGKIIAQTIAHAEGDWMTTEFVPFTATIIFDTPAYGKNGFLILKKDNPSGLPEHDDAFEIKILFQ